MATAGRVETRTFVSRLLAVAARGQELGDPRSPGAITAWSEICDGIPDAMLKDMIPGTIRLMFRREDVAKSLAACGLRDGISLQHEAIAPYVIAFRRMRAIRLSGGMQDPQALLAETRKELRDLNNRFQTALDEAMRLQEENQRLRSDLTTSRQETTAARAEAEKQRKIAVTARNDLEEAAARTLSKLALALQTLKETMERRVNDPESTLVETASLSVQSYFMVLEDLGRGADATRLAKRILGEKMAASGLP
ncbi:MAG: hypothetical protein H7840_00840 [Alphaproteobacteria bacterium]